MKKTLYLLFALGIGIISNAQNVDLDKYIFNASVISFPANFVPADLRTYGINITVSPALEGFAASFRDKINIAGYTYNIDNPVVRVYGNLNNVRMGESSIKSKQEEKRDNKGKVISSKTVYYVEATYIGLGDYQIEGPTNKYIPLKELQKELKREEKRENKKKDKDAKAADNPFLQPTQQNTSNQNTLKNDTRIEIIRNDFRKEYRYISTTFESYAKASKFWDNESPKQLYNNRSRYVNEYMQNLQNHLNSLYGYPIVTDNYHLWIVDNKNHPEYDLQQKAIQAIKVLMPKLNGRANMTVLKGELEPVLNYFKTMPDKYKGDSKMDKKIRYSAYFNLAKLYFLIDDTQASRLYADALIKNNYDEQDGEKFIEMANELQNQFDFFQVNTRQSTN